MSGSSRTCYAPEEIAEVLKAAHRWISWTTSKGHRYGHRVLQGDKSGLVAGRIADENTSCEICGPAIRSACISKALAGFADRDSLYLSLVLPTPNARAAVAKQTRERPGIGWFIPIHEAVACLSDIPIRAKGGSHYSVEVSRADRTDICLEMLDLWWPGNKWTGKKQMGWPNWPQVQEPESSTEPRPEKEKFTLVGCANATLPRNLSELGVWYIESGEWMNIDADQSDKGFRDAFRRSNGTLRADDRASDSSVESCEIEEAREEDTG